MLKVVVRGRPGIVWEGEASSVSGVNKVGAFDVLPQHANFVTTISGKITIRKTDGLTEEVKVEKGILVVESDRVEVFLGVGSG